MKITDEQRATILTEAEAALIGGDFALVTALLQPLAEAGDPEGQFRLGELYFQAGLIEKEEARSWITKAAAQGHAEARLRLANSFGAPEEPSRG